MPKPPGTLESRKASARFDKVELKGLAGRLGGWKAKAANALTHQLTGGDWVGGHVHLTATHVHFEPDVLHRMAVRDADTLVSAIPLSGIEGVSTRWVIAQKAVDLALADGGVFSFICDGATALAARIAAMAGAARSGPKA